MNEQAVDIGGVSRDMFSSFFDAVYLKLFDGATLLYPAMHSSIDIEDFRMMGLIFSHAYLACGMLPDWVAFPCLASVFLNQSVSDLVMLEAYSTSLREYELQVVEKGLQSPKFNNHLSSDLTTLLSSHGCKEIPTPLNLKRLLFQAARTLFYSSQQLLSAWWGKDLSFWSNFTVQKFVWLYKAMTLCTEKVWRVLDEPEFCNKAEHEVWLFLRKFIGNMSFQKLRAFIRFTTGSVMSCSKNNRYLQCAKWNSSSSCLLHSPHLQSLRPNLGQLSIRSIHG